MEILATGASALLGSWVGAWLSLRRFKRERAFEMRLEWYVATVRLLNRYLDALRKLHRALERGESPDEVARLAEAVDQVQAAAIERADLGMLWVSEEVVEALWSILKSGLRAGGEDPTDRTALMAKTWAELSACGEALRLIANDGRRHLGIP